MVTFFTRHYLSCTTAKLIFIKSELIFYHVGSRPNIEISFKLMAVSITGHRNKSAEPLGLILRQLDNINYRLALEGIIAFDLIARFFEMFNQAILAEQMSGPDGGQRGAAIFQMAGERFRPFFISVREQALIELRRAGLGFFDILLEIARAPNRPIISRAA